MGHPILPHDHVFAWLMCSLVSWFISQRISVWIKKKLHGLSPRANYTDRATAASRRSVANLCG
jgi:hypothetical protein